MRELDHPKATSSERPKIQIDQEPDKLFLLELFTHHPNALEKGVEKVNTLNIIKKGFSNKNSPCFFIS